MNTEVVSNPRRTRWKRRDIMWKSGRIQLDDTGMRRKQDMSLVGACQGGYQHWAYGTLQIDLYHAHGSHSTPDSWSEFHC